MKTKKKLRERIVKGLFTLVMATFMFLGMGKTEVQAREILPDSIKEGDVLYPGDVIIGTGKVGISIYDVNRKKILHVVDGGNLVIQDSYRYKKISEMRVKEVTNRGSVLLDVEMIELKENHLELYKSLLNADGRNQYAKVMQEKEMQARIISLDSIKKDDILYPGDIIVGTEGLQVVLEENCDATIERPLDGKKEKILGARDETLDKVVGGNIIIKDSYAERNVFLMKVVNCYNYDLHQRIEISVRLIETEEEYVDSLLPKSKNNYTKDGIIFDADYYAYHNQDVVAVLGNNEEALYNHYLLYGMQEGRKGYEEQVSKIPLVELTTTKLKSAEKTRSWDLFQEIFNPIWLEERARVSDWYRKGGMGSPASYLGSEICLMDFDDSQKVSLTYPMDAAMWQGSWVPPTFNLVYKYRESYSDDTTFDPEGYWKLTLPTKAKQTELSWYAVRNAFRLVTPDAEALYQELFNVYYGKPSVFKKYGEWVTIGNSQVMIDLDTWYQVEFFFK